MTNITSDLEKLGYFSYCSPSDLEALKTNIEEDFHKSGVISSLWTDPEDSEDEVESHSLEFRIFLLDGESLAENGFEEALEEIKVFFEKIKLPFEFEVGEVEEEEDSEITPITLNGSEYIYEYPYDENSWALAPKFFAEMLNEELKKQNSKEKAYLISGGNEGSLIFLTDDQYNYVQTHFVPQLKKIKGRETEHWRLELPLAPDEWYELSQ